MSKCASKLKWWMDVKDVEGRVASSYFTKAMKCKETATHPWQQGREHREDGIHCLAVQKQQSSPGKDRSSQGDWGRHIQRLCKTVPQCTEINLSATLLGTAPNEKWEGHEGRENGLVPLSQDSNHALKVELEASSLPHCPFAFLSHDTWTYQQPLVWSRKFLINRHLQDLYIW